MTIPCEIHDDCRVHAVWVTRWVAAYGVVSRGTTLMTWCDAEPSGIDPPHPVLILTR